MRTPDEPDHKLQRYLAWLRAEIEYVRRYHDQKERAAWTGTAFYIPIVILLGREAGSVLGEANALTVILALMLVAPSSALLMFVSMQFNRRWISADTDAALHRLHAELITDPSVLNDTDAETLPDPSAELPVWPNFIRNRLREYRTPRRTGDVCSAALRGMMFMWGDVRWPPLYFMPAIEMRMRTEAASYVMIVVATVVAICALWV